MISHEDQLPLECLSSLQYGEAAADQFLKK